MNNGAPFVMLILNAMDVEETIIQDFFFDNICMSPDFSFFNMIS